jgi:threonine/homoserine efflux transporter RhtA
MLKKILNTQPAWLSSVVRKEFAMNVNLSLAPIVSLVAGVLILAVPRLLNYIVAIYLIVIGIIGIFGAGNFHFT